jgi:hypothetical protein
MPSRWHPVCRRPYNNPQYTGQSGSDLKVSCWHRAEIHPRFWFTRKKSLEIKIILTIYYPLKQTLAKCFTLQLISITLATSPRHSEHKPTSNKSPALTAPEKLMIVTSWRHLPHQALESKSFLLLFGMLAHNLAAGAVNLGMDSMGISVRVHTFS